ncbi:MAG: hypothetical protein IKK33_15805 [Lachnospiraceae bacterium]|nr:hypothetical protein [Lachnospiraceae bacterium]
MDDKNMQGVEVGGFLFLNGADANLADKERMQIEYLEKKLNYQNPEQILAVLQKLIEERTFKTPIGMIYLKKMQDFLMNKVNLDKGRIPYIPVDTPCDRTIPEKRTELNSIRNATQKRKEILKSNHKISILLNVILVIALIIMFWVTLQSETPNMINYRISIENKYAAWEQELTERENQVREQERELGKQEQ